MYRRAFYQMDIVPQPPKSAKNIANGIVVEALPNTLFRVELADTKEVVLAYLAGKMRMNRIRVLIGDSVELALDPYGGRARIIRRS